MIAAVLLLQVAAAAPASGASRVPVPAVPVDLSTVATHVHVNRAALEGWVPKKGTPAPLPELPVLPAAPSADRARPSIASAEDGQGAVPQDESVDAFAQPRPWFYGSWAPRPRRAAWRGRSAPGIGRPGRARAGTGRRRW